MVDDGENININSTANNNNSNIDTTSLPDGGGDTATMILNQCNMTLSEAGVIHGAKVRVLFMHPDDEKPPPGPDKAKMQQTPQGSILQSEEVMGQGMTMVNLMKYFDYAGGTAAIIWIVIYLLMMNACTVVGSWFFQTNTDVRKAFVSDMNTVVLYYSLFNAGEILFGSLYRVEYRRIHIQSSKAVFADAFNAVARAPSRWFDSMPMGTVLNLFAKDSGEIDTNLFMLLMMVMDQLFRLLGICVTVAITSQIFVPVTVVMFVTLMSIQTVFSKTSMALKDLEARTRSPLLSQLEESLDGITTLRCFQAHHTMLDIFGHGLNINAQINFLSFASACWLNLYSGIVAACATLIGSYLAVLNKDTVEPAVNLTTLAMLPSITLMCAGFVGTFTEAEKQFNSFMRMRAYKQLEAESHRVQRGTDVTLKAEAQHLGCGQQNLSQSHLVEG